MEQNDHVEGSSQASRLSTRDRIIASAIELLSASGRDAVTTRAVADAAGVQGPTIYRLFGDKRGLLDAVAEFGFASYMRQKMAREVSPDPVENLRVGWNLHVEFGLTQPQLYLIMYADPRPGMSTPAVESSRRMLVNHMQRVAEAGRLLLPVERAADLLHASACGTVLTLLGKADPQRDLTISEQAREATITAITLARPDHPIENPASFAVSLLSVLPGSTVFSEAERSLMAEWLNRLASGSEPGPSRK